MAYATISDVERRLPVTNLEQLTGAAQGSADYDAAINAELERATAVIDGYAGVVYATPLNPSEVIEGLCVDIAAYRLEQARNVIRESEKAAFDEAMRFLRDLSKGLVKLDTPTGEDPQTAGGGEVKKRDDEDYVFRSDTLAGF